MKNIPIKLYLQLGYDGVKDSDDFNELDTELVSWCAQKVDDSDVEYVLADAINTKEKFIKLLKTFSEWVESKGESNPVAGDRYNDLPELSKSVINAAIKHYIEYCTIEEIL